MCSEQFTRNMVRNFPLTSLWSPLKISMNYPGNMLFLSSTENQAEIRDGKIPDIQNHRHWDFQIKFFRLIIRARIVMKINLSYFMRRGAANHLRMQQV